MSYYAEPFHKFFVVFIGGCHAHKGYKGLGSTKKWLDARDNADELEIITREEYLERRNKTVTVYNIMSGKPVEMLAKDVGGPCDPSTERYHSM